MVNSRSIRQLTSLVAAVAVVGAIGVLPAAAVGDPVVTTTTLWLDNPDREYGETVTGGVTVHTILGVDDVVTGRVALLVDDVEVQEWAIVDQPLTFELDTWSLPGEHTVTAVFESDDDFVTSSDDDVFTVAIVSSSIMLVDTSELVFGEAGTIRFDLEAALAPTGEVTLTDGGVVIATGAVEVDPETPGFGTVTLELPAALEPGVHTVMLAYAGNDKVAPSESGTFEFSVAPALTTVTVASLSAPLVVGQTQTLVVEVAPLAGQVADGSVDIEWDGELLGTVVLADGRGELELASPLPVGSRTLFLYYSGDDWYYEPTVAEVHVEVGKAQPVIAVTVPASVAYGAGASGAVTVRLPDGNGGDAPVSATTVQLTATRGDAIVDLGSANTDALGALTFELPTDLAVGDWTIGASIDETAETFGASDDTAMLSVTKLASVTTAVLGSAYGTYGSSSTVTVRVAEIAEDGAAASGMVQIVVDDEVRATKPLVGGTVTVDLPNDLAMGAHSVVARYAGTAEVTGGASASAAYTVRKAASATAVALSTASAKLGAGGAVATITVTVPAALSVAPEGTVVLLNGTTQVGSYPLTGGSVAVPLSSSLALGAHSLTARFEGSAQVEASTSDAATLTIVAATTTTPTTGTPVGTASSPVTASPVTQSAPVPRSAPARASSVSTASRVLAATGANVEGLVAGALALLALGTATTVLAARRRSVRTASHRVA